MLYSLVKSFRTVQSFLSGDLSRSRVISRDYVVMGRLHSSRKTYEAAFSSL
jgi:hypothetical protein